MTVFDFDKYGYISTNPQGELILGGVSENGFLIGKYENEERAKEVLADIYANLDMSRYDMPII